MASWREGEEYVHRACGFPIYQDGDGRWRHVEAADEVFCDIMFSRGSVLDSLLSLDEP